MPPELQVSELPAALRASVTQNFSAACERDAAVWQTVLADESVSRSLPRVWACSDFIAQLCVRKPAYLSELVQTGRLHGALDADALAAELARLPPQAPDAEVMHVLRELRQRELLRIAWRDIAGWAEIEETLREQSLLADVCIRFAYERAYAQLATRFGTPLREDGTPQPLVIIAMGKLGAYELNFSSDVDLVLLYPEDGASAGDYGIEYAEFFLRVAQRMVPWLTARSVDGFVYRVDLRLRPFGDSGPLALSFAAFEHYLQQHGRDWERYAYVKARPVTGIEVYRELYEEVLRPFVYRRYLDYGVFESLRHMKNLIAREVERRELQDNIKLGPGGIREIEFIVQAFQLLRGGSDRRLQRRELNVVLPQLVGQRLLTRDCVAELTAAYRFLRRLENRLQEWADEQTHALPAEAAARERLAFAMDLPSWAALAEQIEQHRGRVAMHFAQSVFGPTSAPVDKTNGVQESVFDVAAGNGARTQALQGFEEAAAEAVLARIDELKSSPYYRKLDETGRRRLSELMPRLLPVLASVADPVLTFERLTRILEMIGGRTVYLALLNENSTVLARLVEVCSRSQFLADQIAAHPLLLDELIDARLFEDLPSRVEFAAELAMRREAVHGEDAEREVQMLREFQRAALFRVALADITGRLPLMKVSDRLTDIAELIVRDALSLAWTQLTQKHGVPQVTHPNGRAPAGMVVVAYGKFGGIELSYSSDLDLVFLYEADTEGRTPGPTPIEPSVFFQRLAQRLMHLLSMHSAAGRLYEVDTRLRPGGNRGLLAQTLGGFEHYQRHEAWTWEHQSLLRARAVAGSDELCSRFETLRIALLQSAVKRDSLREEVRKMRERMRTELSKAKSGEFDMKQDAGGIADLEFLTQYWVLHWAERHPEVALFSDNIRQLESLASGALLPQELVDFLTETYRKYRERLHHASLAGESGIIPADEFVQERARVIEIWRETME